jgi:hypothetical protein
MAHSPGPWQCKKSLVCGFRIKNAIGLDVATLAHDWINNATEDNAKLIAAAPELLDAIEAAEKAINESVSGLRKINIPEWTRLLAQMQAAIAKARAHNDNTEDAGM